MKFFVVSDHSELHREINNRVEYYCSQDYTWKQMDFRGRFRREYPVSGSWLSDYPPELRYRKAALSEMYKCLIWEGVEL